MTTSSDDILMAFGAMALMVCFMLCGQKLEDNYCDWKTREQIKLGIRDKNDEPIKNQGIGMTIGFFLFFIVGFIFRVIF